MASILHLMDIFDIYLTDATVWRRFLAILIGRNPSIPAQSFPFPRSDRQSRLPRVVMVFQGVTFGFTLWKCLSCIILVSKLVPFSGSVYLPLWYFLHFWSPVFSAVRCAPTSLIFLPPHPLCMKCWILE